MCNVGGTKYYKEDDFKSNSQHISSIIDGFFHSFHLDTIDQGTKKRSDCVLPDNTILRYGKAGKLNRIKDD